MKFKCLCKVLPAFFMLFSCNPLKPSGSALPDEFGGYVEPVTNCSLDQFVPYGTSVSSSWSLAPLVNRYLLECEQNGSLVEICSGFLTQCEKSGLDPNLEYRCRLKGINSLGGAQCGSDQVFRTIGSFADQVSSASNASQVTLRWTDAPGATNYKLEELGTNGSIVRVISESATSPFVVSQLQAETTYLFRVTARNSTNYRLIDAPISLTTATVQGLVLDVPTLNAANSLSLSWGAASGLTGITLLKKASQETAFSATSCVSSPCVVSDLTPGEIYSFKLQAMASEATVESAVVTGTPLSTPAGFTVSNQSTASTLDLSWAAVPGATSYQIEYGFGQLTLNASTQSTSISLNGLSHGLLSLRLKAINQAGFLVGTESIKTLLGGYTAAPLSFTDPHSLILSWSTAIGATEYEVRYGVSGPDTLATCTSSPCLISGITAGLSYTFQVKALGGQQGALLSNQVSGAALARPVLTLTPTAFSAQASWTFAGTGADYVVELGTISDTYTLSQNANASPVTFTGLNAGTTYFGRVTASNASGSLSSPEVSFSTLGDTTLTLNAPTQSESGALQFHFTKGGAITAQVVKYGTSTGAYTTTSSCTLSPCVIAGLTAGQMYYFVLEGQDVSTQTYTSTEVAATPLGAPVVLTQMQQNKTEAALTWSSVTGATGYRVRYGSSSGTYQTIAQFNSTSGTLTGLTAGTTLYYKVEALSSLGSAGSVESSLPLVGNFALHALTLSAPQSLTLTWGSAALGTSYSVHYGTSALSQPTLAGACTASPCTVTGLAAGTPYHFKVRASNAAGGSNETTVRTGTPLLAPSLTLTPGATSLEAAWTSAGMGANYTLRRGTVSGTYDTTVSSNASSPALISGLNVATAYYVIVEATNTEGSLVSSEVSAQTTGDQSITLNPPMVLTANTLNFTFTKGSGVDTVVLKQGTSLGTYATTTSCTSSPCSVTGLTAGVTYYFQVEGVALAGGPTLTSNAVSGIPLSGSSNVATQAQSGLTSAQVTCSSVTGATSYRLDYGTVTGTYTDFVTNAGTSLSLTSLTAGGTYFFKCSGVNAFGALQGSEASLTLVQTITLNPLTLASSQALGVSWTGGAGATSVSVFYGTVSGTLPTLVSACTSSPCTMSGLVAGQTYFVQVTGTNASGGTLSSIERSGVPLVTPVVTLTEGVTSLDASWTSAGSGATYSVKYGTLSGTHATTVSSSATSPTSLTGLSVANTYYVVVEAANSTGMLSSIEVSGQPLGNQTLTLDSPTISAANALSFTFTKGSGIGAVVLKQGTSLGTYGTTTTCTTSPCNVIGLTAGTAYYFQVEGTTLVGNSVVTSNAVSGVPLQAAPSLSTFEQASLTSINLAWSAINGASDYRVEYGTSTGSYTAYATTSSLSTIITGLTTGSTVFVRILAQNSLGSLASAETSMPLIPSFSQNALTLASANSLSVSWGNATHASSYRVDYGTSSGVYPTQAAGCTSSPCTISGLTAGTPIFVQVSAMNTSGGRLASNERSGVPLQLPVLTLTPDVLSLLANWTSAGSGATYTLKYGTVSGVHSTTVSTNATSPASISSLTYGVDYFVAVEATNSEGTLSSLEQMSSPAGNSTINLQTPTLSAANSLQFSFTKGGDITSTVLKYGTTSGTFGTTTSCTLSPCTVTGLTAGTTYYFRVEGEDSGANPFFSSEVIGVPIAGATNLSTPIQSTASSSALSWSSVNGAIQYIVDYGTTSGSYTSALASTASTSASLTGLAAGTTYYARVRALNAYGSIPSAEVAFTPIGTFTLNALALTAADSLRVTWSNPLGAATYSISYGTTSGSYPSSTSCSTSPCTVSGLTAGTTYYFIGTATNGTHGSSQSNEVVGTALSVPVLTLTPSNAAISASWTAAGTGATYRLRYGLSSGNHGTTVSTNATSPTNVTSLTPGTTYYFIVEATNAQGTLTSSEQSRKASGVTTLTLNAPSITASNQLDFTWTQGNGIASVVLKQGTVSGTYGATTSCTLSPCQVGGLTAGTDYYFRLEALDHQNLAVFSTEVMGVPMAGATTLNTPTQASTTSASLSWSSVTGATGYIVDFGTSTGTYTSSLLETVSTHASLTSLGVGTPYFIRVRAKNTHGELASAEVSFRSVGTFTLNAITLNAATSLILSWSTPTGATGVSINYGTSPGTYGTSSSCSTSPCTISGLTAGTTYYR